MSVQSEPERPHHGFHGPGPVKREPSPPPGKQPVRAAACGTDEGPRRGGRLESLRDEPSGSIRAEVGDVARLEMTAAAPTAFFQLKPVGGGTALAGVRRRPRGGHLADGGRVQPELRCQQDRERHRLHLVQEQALPGSPDAPAAQRPLVAVGHLAVGGAGNLTRPGQDVKGLSEQPPAGSRFQGAGPPRRQQLRVLPDPLVRGAEHPPGGCPYLLEFGLGEGGLIGLGHRQPLGHRGARVGPQPQVLAQERRDLGDIGIPMGRCRPADLPGCPVRGRQLVGVAGRLVLPGQERREPGEPLEVVRACRPGIPATSWGAGAREQDGQRPLHRRGVGRRSF